MMPASPTTPKDPLQSPTSNPTLSPVTDSAPVSPPPSSPPILSNTSQNTIYFANPTSEKIPVWLDCDPGHDDAMAIILAGHHPKLDLLGISTVHGNQSLQKTTQNAARILRAAGLRHIKIVPGQDAPILKPPTYAANIHGESGLDGTSHLPPIDPKSILSSDKAVPYMASFFHKYPKRITLVATGPLTNVALLLTIYPEVKKKIDKIAFMGGAATRGNTTPTAEFNIYVDPEAAQIVFNSGLPIVMIPLDVTHQVHVRNSVLTTLTSRCAPNSIFAKLCIDLLLFYESTYRDIYGFTEGPPLHDPCAVAYVADPTMFTVKEMRVDVVTDDGLCRGQTVCDYYLRSPLPRNLHVAFTIDESRFFDMMYDAWARADERSALNDPENFSEMPVQPSTVDPLPYLRCAIIDNLPIIYIGKDGKAISSIQHATEIVITTSPKFEASQKVLEGGAIAEAAIHQQELPAPKLTHLKFTKSAATSYHKTSKGTTDPSKQQFYTLDALLYMLQSKDLEFSEYLMESVIKSIGPVAVVDRKEAIEYLEGVKDTAKGVTTSAGK